MSGPTHNEGRRVSPGCYALDAPSICPGGAQRRRNAEDELTQKPPNPLNSQKIGSAFVVSSILLFG